MTGRMMRHVHCPEQSGVVIHAVQPVKDKVFGDEQCQPIPKALLNGNEPKLVSKSEGKKSDSSQQNIQAHIAQHEIDIGCRVANGIKFSIVPVTEKEFQSDQNHIDWRADQQQ